MDTAHLSLDLLLKLVWTIYKSNYLMCEHCWLKRFWVFALSLIRVGLVKDCKQFCDIEKNIYWLLNVYHFNQLFLRMMYFSSTWYPKKFFLGKNDEFDGWFQWHYNWDQKLCSIVVSYYDIFLVWFRTFRSCGEHGH